ncbi:hypothetical protein D7Z96_05090 [Pseudarthrobacter phenanthrenivorans]|uniref:Uncharacterized protein n=1 Tax=Pseudarthrobacter phenanthrenivorans TaxID=361575 RepID=A0A3B0FTG4_PSEPS|nr:hypothetical protein [Pseudarthrobacter phenanthrenivorans]RKO26123.1 hypothetical protein D7Z96_05090 [Pseudarthrobacter phenanthrenivorans]
MMDLDSSILLGARPWLPSPDASNLDVWHQDDVPTIGTFDFPDCHVLFTLVGVPDTALTAWAYLPLEVAEFKELHEMVYESVLKMRHDVHQRFESRPCVFAVADNFKISSHSWTPVEEPVRSLFYSATAFLQDYVAERILAAGVPLTQNWELSRRGMPTGTEQDQIEAFEQTLARAEDMLSSSSS